jgi:NitT/TauT family transport system substrate-binding protein
MINETISTFFFNKEQTQIKIVRYALKPTADAGHFFILASGKSGITSPDQLKGVEIGVSQGTVIEYVTYRLLQESGLAREDIKTIAVPKIPERMALLTSGELSAAVMPDPLAALAVQQGAKIILDDSQYPQYGFSVYSFRADSLNTKGDAVKAFLSGIEEAVAMINANPTGYTDILTEQKLVPAPLLETYQLPEFTTAGLPSEVEWNDAMQWAQEMGLLPVDVSYWDSVTGDYLPDTVAVPQ